MIATWPSPAGGDEYALSLDRERKQRLLVIPALFDESNKLRHFTVEVMRALDRAGIDTFLPDLPGQNESFAPLERQSLDSWRAEAQAAAKHFGASHILAIRGGTLMAPAELPGWLYAPAKGASLLRSMLRARVLSAKEVGREEDREILLEQGRQSGLELAGYQLSAEMIRNLESDDRNLGAHHTVIAQSEIGGPSLWLRAEPDHDPEQAEKLAALIAEGLEP